MTMENLVLIEQPPSKLCDKMLEILVLANYKLREKRLVPDEWYWADDELWRRGVKSARCYDPFRPRYK